jgi:hypothetical protein
VPMPGHVSNLAFCTTATYMWVRGRHVRQSGGDEHSPPVERGPSSGPAGGKRWQVWYVDLLL